MSSSFFPQDQASSKNQTTKWKPNKPAQHTKIPKLYSGPPSLKKKRNNNNLTTSGFQSWRWHTPYYMIGLSQTGCRRRFYGTHWPHDIVTNDKIKGTTSISTSQVLLIKIKRRDRLHRLHTLLIMRLNEQQRHRLGFQWRLTRPSGEINLPTARCNGPSPLSVSHSFHF